MTDFNRIGLLWDILVYKHPYLPEGTVLLVDHRALMRSSVFNPDLFKPEEPPFLPLAELQADYFRNTTLLPDLTKLFASALAVDIGAVKPRIHWCPRCSKKYTHKYFRCRKCKYKVRRAR